MLSSVCQIHNLASLKKAVDAAIFVVMIDLFCNIYDSSIFIIINTYKECFSLFSFLVCPE